MDINPYHQIVGKTLAAGDDDFGTVIKENSYYVDKSLLMKEILERKEKVTLITRPRRWGKTLNMSMLQHFFADEVNGQKTAGLFDHLAISQAKTAAGESYLEKYQGKYPVISISLKDAKGKSAQQSLTTIYNRIVALYEKHQYLLQSDQLVDIDKEYINAVLRKFSNETNEEKRSNFTDSIKNLTKLLNKHTGQKCFVLIDEYDTPLQTAYDHGYFNDIADFMREMFTTTLKGNEYLEKGLMTGILDLSKNSVYSGLNNLSIYTVLNGGYSQHFGFTESEVQAILQNQRITDIDMQDIKDWYNGYRVGSNKNHTMVYNPWSIMKCLKNEDGDRLASYWMLTGDPTFIKRMLLNSNENYIKNFEQLTIEPNATLTMKINQHITYQEIDLSADNIWSILLHTGYLTVADRQLDGDYVLKIPNKEVKDSYRNTFMEWLQQKFEARYETILTHLTQGKVEQFHEQLALYLSEETNPIHYKNEDSYQVTMNTIFNMLKNNATYKINHGNRLVGLGYPDCIITPRNSDETVGIILEYKVHDLKDKTIRGNQGKINAVLKKLANEVALKQVEDRVYEKVFNQEPQIEQVLCIGLAFYGRCVGVAYQTIDLATKQRSEITHIAPSVHEFQENLEQCKALYTPKIKDKIDTEKEISTVQKSKKIKV